MYLIFSGTNVKLQHRTHVFFCPTLYTIQDRVQNFGSWTYHGDSIDKMLNTTIRSNMRSESPETGHAPRTIRSSSLIFTGCRES
ncbi:uncharacterized protein C8R40DRAFT_812173 [Lentinula edodes]|uniref:uncharacterized protein n=1 Tax=Lentinula edodes TaxID=5353 RepID=UPI001E8EDD46|nr:uncharacterized protein C8R40DRAFT_812173 [Lentinula edodes]KAH7868729.1 hypothetical protein C8R40DRAFT_812173 [Lentinula edodes]